MDTKLTITLEKTVIQKAKTYAKGKGQSLSNIIENYLKTLSANEVPASIELPPIVKQLKGSFKAPKDFDYKKELTKAIIKKHL